MPSDRRSGQEPRLGPASDERARRIQNELVEEAARQLVTVGLEALSSAVTPSALAKASGAASVDTAYRLLGSPKATLITVAESVMDPGFSSDVLNWPTLSEVTGDAVGAFEAEPSPLEAAVSALRFYIAANFYLPARPIGRLLDAVAATGSEAWIGQLRVKDDDLEVARRLLDVRRGAIEHMTGHFRWMLLEAMSDLQRRPKPGVTIELMLNLMHSMIEGALDRMFVNPECITVDQLATAVVELGLSMTEDGSMGDPRLPADSAARLVFTRLLTEADRLWSRGEQVDDVATVADRVGIATEAAAVLFPTVAELADSVVRERVIAAGAAPGPPRVSVAVLETALRRLALTADEIPIAVQLASTASEPSALDEMRGFVRDVVANSQQPAEADRVAEQLVHLASQGTATWATVGLLLDMSMPSSTEPRITAQPG